MDRLKGKVILISGGARGQGAAAGALEPLRKERASSSATLPLKPKGAGSPPNSAPRRHSCART